MSTTAENTDTTETDDSDDDSSWTTSAIEGVIAAWVVGVIFGFAETVIETIGTAYDMFIGALEDGTDAVGEAIAYVAEVPLSIFTLIETGLADIAASAGPFGPIIVVVTWVLVGLALAALVRFLLWLLPLVIPWL